MPCDPDTDVQVFWRKFPSEPPKDEAEAGRRELCNVPVGECKGFLQDSKYDGFVWDHLEERWKAIRDPKREVRPGIVIMLPCAAGGYSVLGWDALSRGEVEPSPFDAGELPEATSSDQKSCGPPLTIRQHTEHVHDELEVILGAIQLDENYQKWLSQAAWWHDVGKAHAEFQKTLRKANELLAVDELWAKSGVKCRLSHTRKYFRHELASALAAFQQGLPFETAYLVASHHGKVRLSIRA